MSRFELPLGTRQLLCGAGFHDVDAALRAAAVELDSWMYLDGLHAKAWSDGSFRHYTNFLAWADTTAGGINKGIRCTGDHELIGRWKGLEHEPIRTRFHALRNQALKERLEVAPLRASVDGETISLYRSFDGGQPGEVSGQSMEYLFWLRDVALPLLVEAIGLGARGEAELDEEFPIADQMPFPRADPWTTALDPEYAALHGQNS